MTADPCRRWREQIGSLVLGRVEEDESTALYAHLEGCPACRAEAQALMPLASVLPLADPERAEPGVPPHGLAERIFGRLAADRHAARLRRRRSLGLRLAAGFAAAACITVAALLVAGSNETSPRRAPVAEAVPFPRLPHGVHMSAQLWSRPWGTTIKLEVHGVAPGTLCKVSLRTRGGQRVPAGSFRYVYEEGEDGAVLTAALRREDAAALVIDAGGHRYVAPLEDTARPIALVETQRRRDS